MRGARPSAGLRPQVEADGGGAWGVFADMYVNASGSTLRCGVSTANTNFDSVPGTNLAGPAGRLSRFLQECEGRFRHAPGMNQCELSSRLVYLTQR